MPVMLKEETKILFVHIPKCGGSSFEKRMTDLGWRELLSIRGINAKQLRFMRCSPQHMHVELMLHLLRPEVFDHIVTLVREPVARLKSEYAWQCRQKITNLAPEPWIEQVFNEFRNDSFAYDNHIRPQNEFLLDETLCFKLEEDGVNRAVAAISPEAEVLQGGFFQNLFSKQRQKNDIKLKATTKSSSVNEAFERMRPHIQDFYAEDYEVLDYTL
jgi:Sulfotransferase family